MPIARLLRLLTLVLSFFALQLTLLAGGPGCPVPGSGVGGDASAAMTGMAMAGMTMTGTAGAKPATHDGESTAPHSAPCDESAAPQACPTMAPCLFAVLLPFAQVDAPTVSASATVVAGLISLPPSVTAAPELPPPRA
jgi:hypothetical protein